MLKAIMFQRLFVDRINEGELSVVKIHGCTLNLGEILQWKHSSNFLNLKPLRSNSNQRQTFLCNINAFSAREVMRIKDIITQHEFH